MLSPIITLFKHFPVRAYSTVLVMLLIGWHSYRRIRDSVEAGRIGVRRGVILWGLINYIVALLFLAVFGRRSLDYYRYSLETGYSYREAFLEGNRALALQILANIAVFVPLGTLGSLAAKRRVFIMGILLGVGLSMTIELLQLIMRNGTCEVDDLISNSLGAMIGCIAAAIVRKYEKAGSSL